MAGNKVLPYCSVAVLPFILQHGSTAALSQTGFVAATLALALTSTLT
jgi:hypothetical protein